MLCFFFFKQKTAYEMRISDWSSDVCTSDLIKRHTDVKTRLTLLTAQPPAPRQQHHPHHHASAKYPFADGKAVIGNVMVAKIRVVRHQRQQQPIEIGREA